MNQVKENISAYTGLGVYIFVGVVLRYFITFPRSSAFQNSLVIYLSVAFIIIGICFGLFSFIFRNRELFGRRKILFDGGRGVITGFGVGWGGVTAWILAYNPCG